MRRELSLSVAALAACMAAGCGLPPPSGGSGGDDGGSNGGGDTGLPVVTLGVSNPTPQVGEEVLLTCMIVAGGVGDVIFDFQPAGGRLLVDSRSGSASFIVEMTDVGQALTFTCTATDQLGTSEPARSEVIIASPP